MILPYLFLSFIISFQVLLLCYYVRYFVFVFFFINFLTGASAQKECSFLFSFNSEISRISRSRCIEICSMFKQLGCQTVKAGFQKTSSPIAIIICFLTVNSLEIHIITYHLQSVTVQKQKSIIYLLFVDLQRHLDAFLNCFIVNSSNMFLCN